MPTQMEPDVAGSPKTEEGKTVDHQEVSNWRKLEETVKTMGVNKPAEMTVIMHDGTGSGGLPRFRSGGVWNKNNEVSSPTTPTWLPLELLFGPVGHTHTGMDAVHKFHNVELGHMARRKTTTD